MSFSQPAIAFILLSVALGPAANAGQTATALDLTGVGAGLPPPADTGKAATTPPFALTQPEPGGCLPPLPCGTRLLGTVRKDGAVELSVPALRW